MFRNSGLFLSLVLVFANPILSDDPNNWADDVWLCESCEDNKNILQVFKRFEEIWNADYVGNPKVYENKAYIPGCDLTYTRPYWKCNGGYQPLVADTNSLFNNCTSYLSYTGVKEWSEMYWLRIDETYVNGDTAFIRMSGYVSRLDMSTAYATYDFSVKAGEPLEGYGIATLGHLLSSNPGNSGAWTDQLTFHFYDNRSEGDWEIEGISRYYCKKDHTANSMKATFEAEIVDRMRPLFEEAIRSVFNGN